MTTSEPPFRPIVTPAFWSCLLASAVLFAAVALSPRIRTYRELNREYVARQRALVATEGHVEYLQRVAGALEHDADFAREVARVDFDAAGEEERIPVAATLRLNAQPAPGTAAMPADDSGPTALWESPLVDALAAERTLRAWLLAGSALLAIFAFTFLCGDGSRADARGTPGLVERFRRWIDARYRARQR